VIIGNYCKHPTTKSLFIGGNGLLLPAVTCLAKNSRKASASLPMC
jgi:hypothetical protein